MDGDTVDTSHKQIPLSPVSRSVLFLGLARGPGANPSSEDVVTPMDQGRSDVEMVNLVEHNSQKISI